MTLDEISALAQTGESETLEFKSTTGTRREARWKRLGDCDWLILAHSGLFWLILAYSAAYSPGFGEQGCNLLSSGQFDHSGL